MAVRGSPLARLQSRWYPTLQFLRALDSLCLGLWVLGKNKTQILRRLKAVAAKIIAEKEQIIDRAGALRFTASEQAQLKKVLTDPIGWKKRFFKPLLLRLNAHMLDARIPIYFPKGVTIEHVLPRQPAANGVWREKYPNATRRKVCTELLGNYALLTHPIKPEPRIPISKQNGASCFP